MDRCERLMTLLGSRLLESQKKPGAVSLLTTSRPDATLGAMKLIAIFHAGLRSGLLWFLLLQGARAATPQATNPPAPRIVNLYNFIRNSDSRLANSEQVLFDATRQQIQLIKQAGLPATWALQYSLF